MNNLLSVIIPVFKAEKSLCKCIDSIILQTYKNLEIILVDDGSPDNCPAICDDYARKDNRIKVIHKQNEGVSSARNTGLENANGEYIAFVDSDDYIDVTMYEKLMNEAVLNNREIVFCGYNLIEEGKITPKIEPQLELTLTNKQYYYNFIRYSKNAVYGYIWRMVVKSEIAKSIKFNSELFIAEDLIYLLQILDKTKHISVVNEYLYNHFCFINDGKTTKYDEIKHIKSYIFLGDFLSNYFFNIGMLELADYLIYQHYLKAWNCYIYDIKSDKNKKKFLKNNNELNQMSTKKGLEIFLKEETNKKQRLLAILLYYKLYGLARCMVKVNKLLNRILGR